MAEHAKTPWEYRPPFIETSTGIRVLCVYGGSGSTTRLIYAKENPDKQDEINAANLVISVNAHDDLVAACTSVVVSAEMNLLGRDSHAVGTCRAAIAKAGHDTPCPDPSEGRM